MPSYFAVVFTDLVAHTAEWTRVPRKTMVALIGEYRYLAESLAGQFGSPHRDFTGDGHMFLFESSDGAVQFGLKLLESWAAERPAGDVPRLSLRVGCHFGECTPMQDAGWIGHANAVAKRVESEAEPDTLLVTETVLDLLDLPLYEVVPAGERALKGDHLPARRLHRVVRLREGVPGAREPTAEDWFLRGTALIGTEQEWSDEEAEYYRRALELRPEYPEAHSNLAALLRRRGDTSGASQHYQEALRIGPDNPEAHYNYATLLAAGGRLPGAASHFEQALALRPDYVDAHHGYAGVLRRRGDLEGAERHYGEALRLRPQSAEANNDLAVLFEEASRTQEAERHYQEALRIKPDYPEAHYNYALLLEGRGEGADAERHYREALRLRPDYPEAHNNVAALLHVAGRLEEAEEHYLEALRVRPEDPEAHYNYGLLLQASGRPDEAQQYFRSAADLAPDVERFRSTADR